MSRFRNLMMGAGGSSPYWTVTLNITTADTTYGFYPYWRAGGGFCKVVDWGDGTGEDAVTSGVRLSHTYSEVGTYVIKLQGCCSRIPFGGNSDVQEVYDCNFNWDAVCDPAGFDAYGLFDNCINAVFSVDYFPSYLTSLMRAFYRCFSAVKFPDISNLPPAVTNLGYAFGSCSNAEFTCNKLPDNISGSMALTFSNCLKANLDITAMANNAPTEGWPNLTRLANCFSKCGLPWSTTATGSISTFMRKAPYATDIATQPFQYLEGGITRFDDTTVDYITFVVTTTEANQVWGFTATQPTATLGKWYCADYGDNSGGVFPEAVLVYTSGTRVEHAFSNAGTYTIKLAMNCADIQLDSYDSTNGKWEMLGNPTHN